MTHKLCKSPTFDSSVDNYSSGRSVPSLASRFGGKSLAQIGMKHVKKSYSALGTAQLLKAFRAIGGQEGVELQDLRFAFKRLRNRVLRTEIDSKLPENFANHGTQIFSYVQHFLKLKMRAKQVSRREHILYALIFYVPKVL